MANSLTAEDIQSLKEGLTADLASQLNADGSLVQKLVASLSKGLVDKLVINKSAAIPQKTETPDTKQKEPEQKKQPPQALAAPIPILGKEVEKNIAKISKDIAELTKLVAKQKPINGSDIARDINFENFFKKFPKFVDQFKNLSQLFSAKDFVEGSKTTRTLFEDIKKTLKEFKFPKVVTPADKPVQKEESREGESSQTLDKRFEALFEKLKAAEAPATTPTKTFLETQTKDQNVKFDGFTQLGLEELTKNLPDIIKAGSKELFGSIKDTAKANAKNAGGPDKSSGTAPGWLDKLLYTVLVAPLELAVKAAGKALLRFAGIGKNAALIEEEAARAAAKAAAADAEASAAKAAASQTAKKVATKEAEEAAAKAAARKTEEEAVKAVAKKSLLSGLKPSNLIKGITPANILNLAKGGLVGAGVGVGAEYLIPKANEEKGGYWAEVANNLRESAISMGSGAAGGAAVGGPAGALLGAIGGGVIDIGTKGYRAGKELFQSAAYKDKSMAAIAESNITLAKRKEESNAKAKALGFTSQEEQVKAIRDGIVKPNEPKSSIVQPSTSTTPTITPEDRTPKIETKEGAAVDKSEDHLSKIAENSDAQTENIANLVVGFNTLASALGKLGVSLSDVTGNTTTIINGNKSSGPVKTPTASDYARGGDNNISAFRNFIESARLPGF